MLQQVTRPCDCVHIQSIHRHTVDISAALKWNASMGDKNLWLCMCNGWQELVTVYVSIQHIQWHAVHITASWACKCLWGIVLFKSYFIISAVRQLIGQKAVGKVGWRELHMRSVTFYIHETSLNATVRSDLQHCCNKDPDTSAETSLNGTKYDAIPCRWCGSNDERVLEPKTTWMLCAGFCSLPHSYQALLSVPDSDLFIPKMHKCSLGSLNV